jgi:hypothetical protein
MATGDQADFFARIKARMPTGWFGSSSPILDALIGGIASAFVTVYAAYVYLLAQTRLQTSTDGWLDISAADYFGPSGLLRLQNETDAAYRTRIKINIIRERGTRAAVTKILTDLTGRAPTIIEPTRPQDTGAYATNTLGYGVAGAYGSLLLNYQAFITAYRPSGSGIPYVQGYGTSPGGYATPSRASYADVGDMTSGVTDAAIYAAIASVLPAATIAWVSIQGDLSVANSRLDYNFVIDESSLL